MAWQGDDSETYAEGSCARAFADSFREFSAACLIKVGMGVAPTPNRRHIAFHSFGSVTGLGPAIVALRRSYSGSWSFAIALRLIEIFTFGQPGHAHIREAISCSSSPTAFA